MALTTPELVTTFLYKCVECGSKNKTNSPPEDCMLYCSRCGFPTVQTCEAVKHQVKKA